MRILFLADFVYICGEEQILKERKLALCLYSSFLCLSHFSGSKVTDFH